jgi:GAF domain-containing protein
MMSVVVLATFDPALHRRRTCNTMASNTTTDIAAAFGEIARVLASAAGLEDALVRIGRFAVLTVDGCAGASVAVREASGVRSIAHTDDLVAEVDRIQYDLGEGPCVSALAEATVVESRDLGRDERWPLFGARAAERGLHSLLSFHLESSEHPGRAAGTLNLYGAVPGAFSDDDRAVAEIYAAHATIALTAATAEARLEQKDADLRQALASRDVIGQAKGILMERHHLTADDAFALLRRASQRLNRKLSRIAEEVADTGALPEAGG